MSETKHCCRCDQDKPVSDFTKDSRRRDGRRSYCKACERDSKATQRAERSTALQASNHRYWKANARRINRKRRIRYAIVIRAGLMPSWRIGEAVNLSPNTVERYASNFGVSLATIKPHWPQEDEQKLISMKCAGMKQQDIAAALNRTPSAVNWRLVELRKKGIV